MVEVVTTGAARESLHRIAKLFDAGEGEPVYFGAHRRAQGVIVPVDVWERLLEAAEDDVDTDLARSRLASRSGRRSSRAVLDDAFLRATEAASKTR